MMFLIFNVKVVIILLFDKQNRNYFRHIFLKIKDLTFAYFCRIDEDFRPKKQKGLSQFCDIALKIIFLVFLYILIRCLFVDLFVCLFVDLFVDLFVQGGILNTNFFKRDQIGFR